MVTISPLNPAFPIDQQMAVDAGPVVLVNLFTVDPDDEAALIDAWRSDAMWMKQQPGYISTQLHRAVGDGSMYLNYAIWETVADFRAAFSDPSFQAHLGKYPQSAVTAPHLFEKVAVRDCCTA
ncbi:antibiotic biosynthesis monooxygenase family protein [Roseobacter sp. S98]|uniref:antibiotic biosynthesis monooxygenase family protein n=1 Tax=Roseobacter algicola (ex Choi et al. 2025) (nom. illeg.) TaxID=3092138 RepID=UPI0035C76DED